jgi:hypothetical protein
VAALVGFIVSRALLSDPALDTVSAWTDPFGLSALSLATKYWTAAERNSMLPPLQGVLLGSRLLWLGVAAALLALAYAVFRMDGAPLLRRRARSGAAAAAAVAPDAMAVAPTVLPAPRPEAARGTQFLALARFDARFVFRSPAFFVLLTPWLGWILLAAGLGTAAVLDRGGGGGEVAPDSNAGHPSEIGGAVLDRDEVALEHGEALSTGFIDVEAVDQDVGLLAYHDHRVVDGAEGARFLNTVVKLLEDPDALFA